MTEDQVRNVLSSGHKELANDLPLYLRGQVVDDPLLEACRTGSNDRLILVWTALAMADPRIASIVENFLTDGNGKLIPQNFDTDHLERALHGLMPGTAYRKVATNILSYFRDSRIVGPRTHGNTIVGINDELPTAESVPAVVEYVAFRLGHAGVSAGIAADDVELAIRARANQWINLSPDEFRDAARSHRIVHVKTAAAKSSQQSGLTSKSAELPVEAHETESYAVSAMGEREAERREQPVVLAYKHWMEAQGSVVVRLRYKPDGEADPLYCDLYDKTRNNLLEAKGSQTRAAIRMAIGQLADYRRFTEPRPSCAVLLPEPPEDDLESLLKSAGIACVWREGEIFRDNADGRYV
jgi:hypothetical protein